MRRSILALAILLFGGIHAGAELWTTLDYPGATDTRILRVNRSNITVVGRYSDASGGHGFQHVVPAPSDLLLGTLGLGIAGWRLRNSKPS